MRKEFWSGTHLAFDCLADKKRTASFVSAIRNTVKPGDIVVDAGMGTGIFSMTAARAGAKRVYAIEIDNNLLKNARRTAKKAGYENIIHIIPGDASKISIPEKVDVIICEMIDTGLVEELQIPVMNNLVKYLRKGGKTIPEKIINYVDIVNNNTTFFGSDLEAVRYEYPIVAPSTKSQTFSKKIPFKELDFRQKNNPEVHVHLDCVMLKKGKINGVRLSNKSLFPDGSELRSSQFYCAPMILPLDSREIKKRQVLSLSLSYTMCKGFKKLKYFVR